MEVGTKVRVKKDTTLGEILSTNEEGIIVIISRDLLGEVCEEWGGDRPYVRVSWVIVPGFKFITKMYINELEQA